MTNDPTHQLLRLATAGSVDDGKSTLIGRLLWDTKSLHDDQVAAVERASVQRGAAQTDLALLVDGLRAEREQGITIDVAYRYFSTPRRSFILADTPGHVQYTRNMVTGASTADLAIVLVDARHGVIEQTRRHAALSALLRVPHLVLAVNKMDLVDYDRSVFTAVHEEFRFFASRLDVADVTAIPVSALVGDNVVHRSERMPWFTGPTLLEHLESVAVDDSRRELPARFPVQYVIRPQTAEHPDYRGYAGQLASGTLAVGDEVVVLPSGLRSRIEAIDTADGPLEVAYAPQSVTVRLVDDIDVSRGDMIVPATALPRVAQTLHATVCWMSEEPLRPGARYSVKHTTRESKAVIASLDSRLDVTTLADEPADSLRLNDIGRITLRTATGLALDDYSADRSTGSFILIDELTGGTAAAGLVGS
jgi:sulfate adenylyltransferase large subunit